MTTVQNPVHAYSGSNDVFVLKLDANGAYQWHTFYGSVSGAVPGYSIAVDGSSNVYVTGNALPPGRVTAVQTLSTLIAAAMTSLC